MFVDINEGEVRRCCSLILSGEVRGGYSLILMGRSDVIFYIEWGGKRWLFVDVDGGVRGGCLLILMGER